jgi:hypothetical protein
MTKNLGAGKDAGADQVNVNEERADRISKLWYDTVPDGP